MRHRHLQLKTVKRIITLEGIHFLRHFICQENQLNTVIDAWIELKIVTRAVMSKKNVKLET